MMLTKDELWTGLYGAFRLARLKADGIQAFPNSRLAATRSFASLGLAIPLWCLLSLQASTDNSAPVVYRLAHLAMVYLLSMLTQLLATHYILVRLRQSENFFSYVAAFNWCSLLTIIILLSVRSLLFLSGLLTDDLMRVYMVIEQTFMMIYTWFVAMSALRITSGTALSITLMQVLLNILVGISMFAVYLAIGSGQLAAQ